MKKNVSPYPFLLGYIPKDYIWGGTALKRSWHKNSDAETIAESWEMSVAEGGLSVIKNGAFAGLYLRDVLNEYPEFVNKGAKTFELLIKLINAERPLSVQVHPDDAYAMRCEGKSGKTEMWYICDAAPGSFVYLGFNKDIDRSGLEESIRLGGVESRLNKVYANSGDYFIVPAGTLHAIGAGLTLLEVQQSSDVTYRVYDYNRTDKHGAKRELHIDKALEVTNYSKYQLPPQNKQYILGTGGKKRTLASNGYFTVDEVIIDGEAELFDDDGYNGFTVVQGGGEINGEAIKKGSTVFVPRGCFVAFSGKMTLILYHA